MSVFKLIGKNPSGEPHVRRVRFDATPTNAELRSMAAAYFGIMDPDVDVRLTWTDGDGEAVTIASDGDIAAAVAASVKGTVRVEVGTDVKGKKAVLILHAGTDKEETYAEILAAPEFFGPSYEPMGKIAAGGEMAYDYIAPKEPVDWGSVEDLRKVVEGVDDYFKSQDIYNKYAAFCDVSKIDNIGGPDFHDMAESTYVYIHRPKGDSGKRTDGKCMVYFHGGAMVAGGPEGAAAFVNRYAYEANITIISVKYRLAPEAVVPCQIADGYAAFMDVVTNPTKFGIDANTLKIGFFGDSSGAYITAGVGMELAERGQGHLARLQIQMSPGTTNAILKSEEEKRAAGMNEGEIRIHMPFCKRMMRQITGKDNEDEWASDRYLFPNEMGDELAAKVPPVVILTAEYDQCRHASREARDLYARNGTLIHYIELGGGYHCSWMNFEMAQSDVWYKDFTRLTQFYL